MSSGGGLAGHNEPLTVDGIQANTVHAIHYTSIQAPWHMGVLIAYYTGIRYRYS